MRAAGDQAKTSCDNLQHCAGLEAGIEVATHALGRRRLDRVRTRREMEETEASEEEAEEEESRGVADLMGNLTIETAGTEEEAAENLEVVISM